VTDAAVSLPAPSRLQQLQSRGRLRGTLALLGPAFVACIAYVDPGNFATNIAGGAKYGYLLLWVLLSANLMASCAATTSRGRSHGGSGCRPSSSPWPPTWPSSSARRSR